ncbi:MAG: cytochrome c peroxidase [Candidatus Thiodiazotropha sp.]
MKRKTLASTLSMALLLGTTSVSIAGHHLYPIEKLGKRIFDDTNLSINQNQSCASCHDLAWGGTNPDSTTNAVGAVHEGSFTDRFGNRKPPSAAYATPSPIFHRSTSGTGEYVGGMFWDGRATGEKLASPAADQAQGPFLNPVEMGLPDSACVVYLVSTSRYTSLYQEVWGDGISSISFPSDTESLCRQEGVTISLSSEDRDKVEAEFNNVALSIAAYESSPEVNRFSSKFDASRCRKFALTEEQQEGLELFEGKAQCSSCHTTTGRNAVFTDFTYDNLGVPKNPENPALRADPNYVDYGLGGYLKNRGEPASVYEPELGKMKVPTLRNVSKKPSRDAVKAYTHNGYFKTLKGLVHFYNTRDVKPSCQDLYTEAEALAADCWPSPEVPENVNTTELGNLGLSEEEENAIVAFLNILTDREERLPLRCSK